MRNSIYFHIFKGKKYFVAEGVGVPIVTQGKNLDELSKNVREAVSLYIENKTTKKEFSTKHPSIFMNVEMGLNYA